MNYSVLVVDDEDCIRELCEDVLPMWGYEVDTAEDGFQGIDKAKTGKYQVVLTDIKMPECDGLTVLEKVKAYDPQIEIIVMTAYGTIETAVNAMKKGAYDFIMKPLSLNQMQAVLSKCVEKIELTSKNKELTELNRRLRELNEMKEKFITITSHELRTPVCSITGFVELIKYSLSGILEDKPETLLSELETIVKGLADIVSDMHDLAAMDMGGFKLTKENLNLVDIAQHVKNEFFPILKDRQLPIEIHSPEVLTHKCDKRRIRQALRELVQNSVKFTPDKGKIDILLSQENNRTIISVKDTGIGIPPDRIDTIFEKFYEVQDSTLHSSSDTAFMGGGLGVGLSLVKEIVISHGGTVSVTSQSGKGSTFTMELPCEEEV